MPFACLPVRNLSIQLNVPTHNSSISLCVVVKKNGTGRKRIIEWLSFHFRHKADLCSGRSAINKKMNFKN